MHTAYEESVLAETSWVTRVKAKPQAVAPLHWLSPALKTASNPVESDLESGSFWPSDWSAVPGSPS